MKINGQDYYSQTPNIQQFDNSGHTHQSWTGLTIAATNPAEDGDKEEPDKAEAPKQKPAFSKVEDECCQKMLLTHLNANIGYYNRAIWFLQDPVERRLLLRIALTDYPHILNGLDDVPLASSGNYVAFAYDDPEKMSRIEKATDDDKINRLEAIVSFPTRGVFAEAQLGHCNSCEKRDVTRFWKWEQSPCEMAPKIEGLTPGPKGQQPTIPQPAQLPQPIIQIAQPLTEPDPVGLAAALKLLGTADIFRDMSTKQEVSKLLDGLVKGTVDIAKAREMANKISSNGGSSSGKGKTTIEAKQAPSESNASDQIDKLDAIQYGKDSGLINEAEASDAATGVLGGGRVLFASADAGFVPDAGSTKKLSGASWVSEFPYSTRLADLEPTFRANVDNFITAVSAAGMNYDVITTYRPKERAYLMHYCCEIIKGTILPKDVPAEAGVDIQWDHGTIADSKRGAQDMFDGYKIDMKQGCPALHTKHQYGTAVDLSVTWTGKPKIKDANGNEIEIVSTATNPANSSNTKLIAVAATYGVIHLIVAGDKNHWSDDGT